MLDGDRHSVLLRLRPDTYKIVRANGIRLLFRLSLPPGRYQLRAAVHEAGSGSVGSVHYDMEIPDYSQQPLGLSGIVLTSTRAAAIPTPRSDPHFSALLSSSPTGSRRFSSDETAIAFFALYSNGDTEVGPIDILTTVSAPDGTVWFSSNMPLGEEEFRAATNAYGCTVRIPLAEMSPGAYVLRVQARSRDMSTPVAVRQLPFHIGAAVGVLR